MIEKGLSLRNDTKHEMLHTFLIRQPLKYVKLIKYHRLNKAIIIARPTHAHKKT